MSESEKIDVYEVVKKLIGSISPIGETTADDKRFENLKQMTDLVNKLVTDIDDVSYNYKNSHEFSVKRAGEYADKFLTKDLGIVNE